LLTTTLKIIVKILIKLAKSKKKQSIEKKIMVKNNDLLNIKTLVKLQFFL